MLTLTTWLLIEENATIHMANADVTKVKNVKKDSRKWQNRIEKNDGDQNVSNGNSSA